MSSYYEICCQRFFSYEPLKARKKKNLVQTSYLQRRVTRFAIKFFPTICLTQVNKGFYTTSYLQGQRSHVLNQEFLFLVHEYWGSEVTRLGWSIGSYKTCSTRKPCAKAVREQTTLRSKSSTIKGLLSAPDPHNHKKGTLSDQPRLSRVSPTVLLCCWGHCHSKMCHSSWLTLRRMPYGWGTLKILLQSICSKEGPHYRFNEAQGSCQKTSNNQAIHKFGYPLVIPYPGCTS